MDIIVPLLVHFELLPSRPVVVPATLIGAPGAPSCSACLSVQDGCIPWSPRAAGASAAAANEIANDAKAKQERALRTAVTAILKTHDESHESPGLTPGLTRGRPTLVTRHTPKTTG